MLDEEIARPARNFSQALDIEDDARGPFSREETDQVLDMTGRDISATPQHGHITTKAFLRMG
jgi:hypothetical protein